jgi:hypothetical protein
MVLAVRSGQYTILQLSIWTDERPVMHHAVEEARANMAPWTSAANDAAGLCSTSSCIWSCSGRTGSMLRARLRVIRSK